MIFTRLYAGALICALLLLLRAMRATPDAAIAAFDYGHFASAATPFSATPPYAFIDFRAAAFIFIVDLRHMSLRRHDAFAAAA